ncbi:hypothetical protein PR048_033168 [Dryococelus australis]|uniref:RING-type domain-containing protein n=1 Tax=Dryococelus australis TaxID=614101 RepID=A0ABQ9G2U6_9NEOP|nr:hypothetical protein PR048_033168 [Dryococelus australis]
MVSGVRELVLLLSEGRRWSWVNGSVLAIHCYCNVYQRLQSGWVSFLQRREAARRTHSLPNATSAQLSERANDVCPICQVGMTTAKVTACGHLFHASCLRRWLYVQARCPLCSAQVGTASVHPHSN